MMRRVRSHSCRLDTVYGVCVIVSLGLSGRSAVYADPGREFQAAMRGERIEQ